GHRDAGFLGDGDDVLRGGFGGDVTHERRAKVGEPPPSWQAVENFKTKDRRSPSPAPADARRPAPNRSPFGTYSRLAPGGEFPFPPARDPPPHRRPPYFRPQSPDFTGD